MALGSAIAALQLLGQKGNRLRLLIISDSEYLVKGIREWAPGWERRGWKRKTGPIQNLDLVQELYRRATARPELRLEWIQAHAGARWNEYADSLSTAYRRDEL
jgi:ribonuclease HI